MNHHNKVGGSSQEMAAAIYREQDQTRSKKKRPN
jgi:hypothetical protein